MKVEASEDDYTHDVQQKLDHLIRELADVKKNARDLKLEAHLLCEDIREEVKARAGLEYRVELLERKAA